VAVAAAHDATITVNGPNGTREIAFAAFPVAFMAPAIEPNELVATVRFALWPSGHGHGFVEFARRHGDFAIVSAAALLHGERVSITLGGVAPAPLRMSAAEKLFAQKRDAGEAAELCGQIDALDDHAYPAWYRKKLAVTLVKRALERAAAR